MNRFINKKSYKKWFVIYLAYLVLQAALFAGVYIKMEDLTKKYATQYSYGIMSQIEMLLDSELENINKFILNMPFNENLNNAAGKEFKSIADTMEFYSIEGDMTSYAARFNLENDFYIYFKNSDVVLTKNGFQYTESAFSLLMENSGQSVMEFEQLLQKNFRLEYMVINDKIDNKGEGFSDKLLVVHSFADNDYIVIVRVNTDNLNSLLERREFVGGVTLFGKDGNVLYQYGGDKAINEFGEVDLSRQIYSKSISGEKYYVSVKEIGFGRYFYALTFPLKEILSNIIFIRAGIALLIAFILMMGYMFISSYTNRVYMPLENVVKKVASMMFGEHNDKSGGIEKEVVRIENEIAKHIKRYNYGEKAVVETMFQKVMSFGAKREKGEYDSILEPYNHNNIVALIESPNYPEFFENEAADSIEDFCFIVNNVLGELLDGKQNVIFNKERFIVLILSLDGVSDNYETDGLPAIFEYFIDFMEEKLEITVRVSCGSVENGIDGVRRSYLNAECASRYSEMFPQEKVFKYSELVERTGNFVYTQDDKRLISNYMKNGDDEKALEYIFGIIDKNFFVNNISYDHMRFLLSNIAFTVYDVVDEKYRKGECSKMYDNLKKYLDIEDYRKKLILLVKEYCAIVRNSRTEDNILTIVDKYLEENYMDININNEKIAEACNLSRVYLSAAFKRSSNENLVDYIGKFRINKAKELYLHTNESIAEIAGKVGFVNSNTFIRAFKKYEGITPGQWRKNNL